MAGVLPGVESARRRRCHQSGSMNSPGGSRRPSFCLYSAGHDTHSLSSSSMQRNTLSNQYFYGGTLGDAAREAKERLDEKLRSQSATEITRHSCSMRSMGGSNEVFIRGPTTSSIQREVFSSKKSGSRQFSWSKLAWKASEQAECAVCLEEFRTGDDLVHLPCAHRFHGSCVVPWLESSSRCPCCRMTVSPSFGKSSVCLNGEDV